MKTASSVVSLVTYTEGIPEFLRFRIHSVYVKEASHSCPHLITSPRSQDLSSYQWSKSQSKLTRLQTPPRSDLKYTKCMKRYQMFENKIFRNTIFNGNEQFRANKRKIIKLLIFVSCLGHPARMISIRIEFSLPGIDSRLVLSPKRSQAPACCRARLEADKTLHTSCQRVLFSLGLVSNNFNII